MTVTAVFHLQRSIRDGRGVSVVVGPAGPFSYASDVAMTVLLPALLVVAFGFLQAGSRRERAFFFAATAMLV